MSGVKFEREALGGDLGSELVQLVNDPHFQRITLARGDPWKETAKTEVARHINVSAHLAEIDHSGPSLGVFLIPRLLAWLMKMCSIFSNDFCCARGECLS